MKEVTAKIRILQQQAVVSVKSCSSVNSPSIELKFGRMLLIAKILMLCEYELFW
jgi:hypothetical protein